MLETKQAVEKKVARGGTGHIGRFGQPIVSLSVPIRYATRRYLPLEKKYLSTYLPYGTFLTSTFVSDFLLVNLLAVFSC